MSFSCLFCPWTYEGTLGEGKVMAESHRSLEHPEAIQRTRRGRKRQPQTGGSKT